MAKVPGMIRRRGKSWNVVLRVAGGRHEFGPQSYPELGPGSTHRDVEEWTWRKYKELEDQAERAERGLPTDIRFSALLSQFEEEEVPLLTRGTQAAYEDTFKPVRDYFINVRSDPRIHLVRAKDIRSYLSWRRVNRRGGGAPLSNRTLQKDRAVLHRLFRFADAMEYREGNPVARVKAPKWDGRDPVILTDDEYDRLIEEARKRGGMLHLYALVLGETGMRAQSEALHLQWDDVDLQEGFIWISSGRDGHRTKSGKGRWTPLTPRLNKVMREHFAEFRLATYGGKRTPWIFHHTTTRRNYQAGERMRRLRVSFDTVARDAKLPDGFRRHDLRHRRVTTWLAGGADVVKVKEAVGHSDLRTTMQYQHLSREHLRSLVDGPDSASRRAREG